MPTGALVGFSFFGPTCDSADAMRGPFHLPADVAEGDWIEIGQLGAYGGCLRTAFNGFDRARLVEVRDGPLLTGTQAAREAATVEPVSRARKSATDITCAVEAASMTRVAW